MRESFHFSPWQEYFISSKLKSTLTTWISSVRLTSLYIRFWRYHHHTSYLSFVPISKEKLNKYFTKMYIFIFHFILMFTLAHNFQKETTHGFADQIYILPTGPIEERQQRQREKSQIGRSRARVCESKFAPRIFVRLGENSSLSCCKFQGKIIQKSKHSHLSVYISTYTNEHQEKLLINKSKENCH